MRTSGLKDTFKQLNMADKDKVRMLVYVIDSQLRNVLEWWIKPQDYHRKVLISKSWLISREFPSEGCCDNGNISLFIPLPRVIIFSQLLLQRFYLSQSVKQPLWCTNIMKSSRKSLYCDRCMYLDQCTACVSQGCSWKYPTTGKHVDHGRRIRLRSSRKW